MYKNIVFDLGGVVVGFDPRSYLADHFYDEALENELYALTFGSREWRLLDAGECTREEANAAMMERARKAGRAFEAQAVLDNWFSMLRSNNDTIRLMEQLKARGCRLYYLSNIPFDVLNMMERRDFWPLFEGGVGSCELRVNKPDPAIYETLLARYGLDRAETLFIDDNAANAHAAYDLGIESIHFQGARALADELIAHGLPVRRPHRHRGALRRLLHRKAKK